MRSPAAQETDTLSGGWGDDTITGGAGADAIDGGTGLRHRQLCRFCGGRSRSRWAARWALRAMPLAIRWSASSSSSARPLAIPSRAVRPMKRPGRCGRRHRGRRRRRRSALRRERRRYPERRCGRGSDRWRCGLRYGVLCDVAWRGDDQSRWHQLDRQRCRRRCARQCRAGHRFGFNDVDGSSRSDQVEGGAGDDLFKASGGADTLIGGAGFDTADYCERRDRWCRSCSTARQSLAAMPRRQPDGDRAGNRLFRR